MGAKLNRIVLLVLWIAVAALPATADEKDAAAQGDLAYYREPALHGDTLVFLSEGDLWRVPATGGTATRLTTHPDAERGPAISPDGKTLAFMARYEGPREIYTMPIGGGRPVRQTYGLRRASIAGFSNDGRIVYATRRYATLPNSQLVTKDPATGAERLVPLALADQAAWSEDGKTLYFTRLPFQGSHCKRYKGGSVQQLWRFGMDAKTEAVPLTGDYDGTSKNPMYWKGRLYFLSDRDGTMNLWSLNPEGPDRDLRQVTKRTIYDIKSASLSEGRIAYRVGADIRLLDLASGSDVAIPIRIASDADHLRTNWIKDPFEFLTSAHVAPDGKRVALTSRGRVFVAPVGKGRRVRIDPDTSARARDARFSADGKDVLYFSDRSGEMEIWSGLADGTNGPTQRTSDATILRTRMLPAPGGALIAHQDKLARLWLLDTQSNESRLIEPLGAEWLDAMTWSADGRWLVYTVYPASRADHGVLRLVDTKTGTKTDVTTERYDSRSPAFSRDGKWLYFLSDRHFNTVQRSPWGARGPDPHFDRQTRIYALALKAGQRSPFLEEDELHAARTKAEAEKKLADKGKKEDGGKRDGPGKKAVAAKKKPKPVEIDLAGIAARLYLVPVPPGNYTDLVAAEKHLLWLAVDDPHARSKHGGRRGGRKKDLKVVKIGNEKPKVKTRLGDVTAIELSTGGEHLLVRRGKRFHVLPADSSAEPKGETLAKLAVSLDGWTFPVDPQGEWQQMYDDAWRLHRDYFYDANMHGVDWPAMRKRYAPLVGRVRDRAELEDVTGMLISELSALHANVYGGQLREGPDKIDVGFLGARLAPDRAAGGYRIEHIYQSDPEEPDRRSPLARQHLDIQAGDVIVSVNSRPAASSREMGQLLVNQVGRQVRLGLKRKGREEPIEAIVKPISARAEASLRYHEWEYTRRLAVDRLGSGRLGYVHLRYMGAGDMAQFARDFYPVFDREGLIIDVRHNGGGNIDSWVLARLMRKIWMYWTGRTGKPSGNMQYAPRGHLIVLCDQHSASDAETLCDGFKRLGLGPVLGTRTWGGEIWLSDDNRLSDGGIARAGMWGVYGPKPDGSGQMWLVEGHGVDPDIVVDNLPHETFTGRDRQLDEAVKHLLERLKREPVPVPKPPPHPDKSVPDNRKR